MIATVYVVLSTHETDGEVDLNFRWYVVGELKRRYPGAKVAVTSTSGPLPTAAYTNGRINHELAKEIAVDWWANYFAKSLEETST